MRPFLMESAPRVGPTVMFWTILTVAGSAPALRTMARSAASLGGKGPVIWALPLPMRSWITGAERTTLSRMMARRFLTLSPVIRANSWAPRLLNSKSTR